MRFASALALLVVGLGACTSGGDAPLASPTGEAAPSVTATPNDDAPTPSATSTATPSARVPMVRPLEFGDAVGFPEGVAILATIGCTQCDGPTRAVQRLTLGDDGSVVRTNLIGEEDATTGVRGTIVGHAVSASGTSLAVAVCSSGTCLGLDWPQDPEVTILRSDDAGWSWSDVGRYEGMLIPVAVDADRVVVADVFDAGPPPQEVLGRYRELPGGGPVAPSGSFRKPRSLASPTGTFWIRPDGLGFGGHGRNGEWLTTLWTIDKDGVGRNTIAVVDLVEGVIHPVLLNGTEPVGVSGVIAVVPLPE